MILPNDFIIHDMIKTEMSIWQYIHENVKEGDKSKPVKNHIFNFYEYLAYLILTKKIPGKKAIRIWKPNIINMYEQFPKDFNNKRKDMKTLYNKWK